jgi:hypothetical protein
MNRHLAKVVTPAVVLGVLTVHPSAVRAQTAYHLNIPAVGESFAYNGCSVTQITRQVPARETPVAPGTRRDSTTTGTNAEGQVTQDSRSSLTRAWDWLNERDSPQNRTSANIKKEREEQERKDAAGKLDTLVVRVMRADGAETMQAPAEIDILIGDRWAARIERGRTQALVVRTAGTMAAKQVRVELPNHQPICGESIPGTPAPSGSALASVPTATTGAGMSTGLASQTGAGTTPAPKADADTLADPALTLQIGVERSSSNNFDADKTSPAIGIRWDLGGRKRFLRMTQAVMIVSDLTQVAHVREYRSCHRTARTTRLTVAPGDVLAFCLAPDTVGPDYVYPEERVDSVRAGLSSTWRTFMTARTEADPGLGFRIGLVGMIGFQTDPRSFTTTGRGSVHRPLRLMRSFGIGFRNVDGVSNVERLRLDVLYGEVQNFVSVDRPAPIFSREDTVRTYAPEPFGFGRREQLQGYLSLRLWKGAYIRAFSTFNAPGPRLPRTRTGPSNLPQLLDPGAPDLVRVAFQMTRDVKAVWDTLTGTKAAKDPGATTPPVASGSAGAGSR